MFYAVKTDFGFSTVINNSFAKRVDCYIKKGYGDECSALCKVSLKDGSVVSSIEIQDPIYVGQYGTPVSESGILFVGGWYKKDGLRAYDVITGENIWTIKKPHVRELFLNGDFIIVFFEDDGIYKIRISDGGIDSFFKTSSAENVLRVDEKHVLANWVRSNIVVLNIDTMQVVRKYQPEVPYLSPDAGWYLRNEYLSAGKLIIEGTVCDPFSKNIKYEPIDFTKIIDEDFDSLNR